MKILANDGISEEGKKALEIAGYTVITDKVDQTELANKINEENYEIVLVRSATTVRKEVIDACPGLKLIGRGGVGMDNIDVTYAREKGVKVINTPASSSQSVAELVMGQMFSISRFLHDSFKNIEHGDFNTLKKNYAKGIELRGKTLGIIGFGRIGQSLASYALAIGMKVKAIELQPREVEIELAEIQGYGIPKVNIQVESDWNNVIPYCDFISVHVPKQANGEAVIGEKEFSLMKKGVRLINAARGGVINETALLTAIENGIVSYTALDVFENEPTPNKQLLNHPKIATTPHIGAATLEAQDRIGLELANLIIENFGKKN
ncbi:MAG: D-2-hydroxyacid dehydrogenase [Crocinitomicaceae bacterium]|jgi:D-3-phosphoglycerate dehydrogenase